jgi:ABC-type antimicrobial peptide transport system permease subunit
MGALLRQTPGEAQVAVRYVSKRAQFRIGDELFDEEFIYADPEFTRLFTVTKLYGSLDLTDKSTVVISDQLAITYFGHADVVGKALTQVIGEGQSREFTVGGVYKAFPANSSFRFKLLSNYDNYFIDPSQQSTQEGDWKRWTTLFLNVEHPEAAARIAKQLQAYVNVQNEARPDLMAKEFFLEPFAGMADRAVRQRNQGHWFNMPMPPAGVLAPFFMAGFILLVACFNFTNHSIAMAGKRLKEIGIRKVVGGRRRELIVQFLSETFFFCLIALAGALFLGEYFVAGWDAMWPAIELSIRYEENWPFFATLAGLIVVTAALAGGYPALYISSFRPIQVLRDRVQLGGMNWFTKSLLVVQFSISLAAVIFALAFYFNSNYQREFDLGYTYRGVIQVPVDGEESYRRLRNELATLPGIEAMGGSQHHVYSSSGKASVTIGTQNVKEVDLLNVGDDYFKTLNVRMLAGRGFERDRASDLAEGLVVNEEFVRRFNLGDAVGSRVLVNDTVSMYVVGVVKDVYLNALFQPLAPVVFRYVGERDYRYLVASAENPAQVEVLNEQVREAWKKIFPSTLYPGRLMEERMVMALDHFDAVVIIYSFLGLVAIVMSVSGLFGLMSIHLQKRTKEIGIRKILGAATLHIVFKTSKIFVVVMAISILLGGLLGSTMVNAMMDSVWEYYVAVNPKVLTLAVGILLAIASATIYSILRRATMANPVDALRYE